VFYNIANKEFYHSACPTSDSVINNLAVNGQEVITASSNFGFCTGLRSFHISNPQDTVGTAGSFTVTQVTGPINTISIFNGNLYIGGFFSSVASEARDYLAAFKLSNGEIIDTWQPIVNSGVYTLL